MTKDNAAELLPHRTGQRYRDELNFAEFPIASVSDTIAEGQKTLEFTDEIFDRVDVQQLTADALSALTDLVPAAENAPRLDRAIDGLAPVIAKIKPKWSFLAPRFTDFNQKSVPYLVDLYGRQIIDLLLTTANG